MGRHKKYIISIIIAILLLLASANVYAANDTLKTALKVDNSQVKKGENVKVTIALSDIAIQSGEKGIGAYTASIDFDSSILEYVSTSETDNWEAPFYQDSLIIGNTKNYEVVKTAQDIGIITFKVKENAKIGETTIKLTNFSGSNAVSDVDASESSIKISIVENNNTEGNTTTGESTTGNEATNENPSGGTTSGNTQVSESNSNNNTQNGETSSNNSDTNNVSKENLKPGILPQTGDTNITIFILINVCALLVIGVLVKIKLLNKKILRK